MANEVQVGATSVLSAFFVRPGDTTPYSVGDLIANNVTAGSVVPLSWAVGRANGGTGWIIRGRFIRSEAAATVQNVRLHLYKTSPTIANGDNVAWSTTQAGYLGAIDFNVDRQFTDAAQGTGVPITGPAIAFVCAANSQLVYGLLEARNAYTPLNAEVFTIELEVEQN
jgi:hypothetical protein